MQFYGLTKVELESKIFVIISGGRTSSDNTTGLVSAYSVTENEWLDLPALNIERESHSSCCLASNLFVFGGHDGRSIMHAVEILKLATADEILPWVLLQNNGSFEPRQSCLVCPIDDHSILLAGGFDSDIIYADAYIFDIQSHTWS